ncbi:MAG: hypothetical protein ACRC7N_17705 [Clostridium sp.]
MDNNTIIINSDDLSKEDINVVNLEYNNERYSLIKGRVFDKNNLPAKGVAILVIEIILNEDKQNNLGYTFTNDKGEYIVALVPKSNAIYELNVYPLVD